MKFTLRSFKWIHIKPLAQTGASFFQDHWVVIKDLLCTAIKDFFPFRKTSKGSESHFNYVDPEGC